MKKINENDIKALETAETEIRDTLRELYELKNQFKFAKDSDVIKYAWNFDTKLTEMSYALARLKFANESIEATNQKKSFMKAIFEN